MKRILGLLTSVIFTISLFPFSAFAENSNPIIKVGLYFASSALPTANLANEVGNGYSLGYFDSSKNFNSLYAIADEKITVMKDENIYLGGDDAYYDTLTSSTKATIGAYHVQPNKTFNSSSEADSYAKNISGKGLAAFTAYVNGSYVVRVGSYTSQAKAEEARASVSSSANGIGTTVVGGSTTGYTVTVTKTNKILFEYDAGGNAFGIMPKSPNVKSKTWFKGYQYYGGFGYLRTSGNLSVINYVALDDYVKGVIPYEMNPSWHIEALKAQALCARGYAYSSLGKHAKYGFDVCADVDCQVYRGAGAATDYSDSAVNDTAGQFVSFEGKAINAVFFSSDGGSTENSENVWGTAVPYLRAVSDPYEDLDNIKNGRWNNTITNETVAAVLKDKGYSLSGVSNMYIDKLTDAGNVYRLTVMDSSGNQINFEKEKARTILNSSKYGSYTYSMRYRIGGSVPTTPTIPSSGEGIYINGSAVSGEQSVQAIGGDGTVKTVNSLIGQTVITGSGKTTLSAQAAAVQAVASTTSSNGSYVINGTGWGHNVGMSQYGAKGMAEKGFTYEQILKFYYTNVTISNIK